MNPLSEREAFAETWDLSMSTVPFIDGEENELDSSSQMLLCEMERNEQLANCHTYYGLPNRVRTLIMKYKGIRCLYDWQVDCLNTDAVSERKNLLYSLPTSGGKTLVAEIIMLRELVVQKKNVILVLPYVALAQEKVRSLAPFALDLDFYIEEFVGGKGKYPPVKHYLKRSIYICTIEKAAGLIDSLLSTDRIEEVGTVVVDEIHLLGDATRGPIMEMMISKLIFATKNVHIVAMSATIGNLDDISQFLNAELYVRDFRPVELIQYVKCDNAVYRIELNSNGTCCLKFDRTVNFNYSEEMEKIDPAYLGGLVLEVIPENSCLVFCATKNLCSNFALLICRIINRSFKEHRKAEKISLLKALAEEGQDVVCTILRKTIPYGVAYHHSGLTNAERKLLEEAFTAKTITCICCTSTLAAGINLPAKRVIITSPYVGRDFLKLSTYKQMSGRAGRMGLSNVGESYLMCQFTDKMKVLNLLNSTMDRCSSRMSEESFSQLAMSAIGLGIAEKRASLEKLFGCTLFEKQREYLIDDDLQQSIENMVEKCVAGLISLKAIEILPDGQEYILTGIAKAALAGNMSLKEAQLVYDNLEEVAEKGLILDNNLHLFYLLTPYSAVEELKIERQVIISVFSDLPSRERKIAEHIGITEVCLIQYVKHGKVTAVTDLAWNRFIRCLLIFDLWNKKSAWDVSKKFNIPRGTVHNFLTRTAAFASSVQRFTEALKIEKFDFFSVLIQKVITRISYCCSSELLLLMQLPSVKIGRAKQLHRAGYKTLRDLVNADPLTLVSSVDHLPRRVAYEIVATAKLLLLEQMETLQEEVDTIKANLDRRTHIADVSISN